MTTGYRGLVNGWHCLFALVLALLGPAPLASALTDVTAGEEAGQIPFRVERIGPTDGAASVRYATCPTSVDEQSVKDACDELVGTASPGIDYTAVSGTITFGDGETSETVNVALVDDSIDEQDETLHFVLFAPERLEIPAADAVTVGTIEDDDPSPVLTATNPSATEDAGNLNFAVSLDRPSARSLSVPWKTSDLTAVAGEDYVTAQGTLSFAAGDTEKAISVAITDDDTAEITEQFAVTFTSVSHLSIGEGGTGSITDNDVPEGLPLVVARGDSVKESEGPAVIAVSLTRASHEEVTVTYRTVDGSAKANGNGVAERDYGATGRQTLTYSAGDTSKDVKVSILDDDIWEPNESFRLELVSATGATVDGSAEVLILDDQDRPGPRAGPTVRVREDAGRASLPVRMRRKSALPSVISFRTASVTATENEDFVNDLGTYTIPAGSNARHNVEISIVNDTLAESEEDFWVFYHTDGYRSTNLSNRQTVTIVDDDVPEISILDHTGAEGITFEFDITLSIAGTNPVTVDWATAPGTATATAPGDYTHVSGTVTFAPGERRKTVQVETRQDDLHECSESFTVALSNPQGARLSRDEATGTINDDDDEPACFIAEVSGESGDLCTGCQPSAGSGLEGTDSIVFTLGLSVASGCSLSVRYATSDDSANAGQDYNATRGSLDIPAGKTEGNVRVTLIDDAMKESVEQFRFTLPDCESETEPTSAYAAIIDNDGDDAVVSIGDAEGREDSGTLAFEVSLSQALSQSATVSYETGDSSALAGQDYTATSGDLTFRADTTALTIEVPIIDDQLREYPTETFSVTLSEPVNAIFAPGVKTVAQGTIIDDEAPVSVSAVAARGSEGSTLTFPVRLDGSSFVPVTVDYHLEHGTALAELDYVPLDGSIRFAPGVTERSVEVTLVDNDLSEPDEGFSLVIHTPVNATLGTSRATGTIADDESPPRIQISASASVTERLQYRFPVALASGSTRSEYPITIRSYTADGTATTADPDYIALDARRTIAASASRAGSELVVRTSWDEFDEDDEYLTIHHELVGGQATLSNAATRLTIVDNDPEPRVAVLGGRAVEGTAIPFMVRLNEPSGRTVSARYVLRHESTTASDIEGAAAGTLTFAPGVDSKTIRVQTVADRLNERDEETFFLELSDLRNVLLETPRPVPQGLQSYSWDGVATGVVLDADPKPKVTISDEETTEGRTDRNMRFSVTMDVAHFEEVLIDYEVRDVTALRGDDYTGSSTGRLTFAAGETSAGLAISVVDDAVPEATETLEVELSHPRFVVVATDGPVDVHKPVGTGTIIDDDVLVTVDDAEGPEGESAVFTLSVAGSARGTVEVDYELAGITATAGSDFELTSGQTGGTVTFAQGETEKHVSVTLLADEVDEDDETFSLALTSTRGARHSGDSGAGTIQDRTPPPVARIEPEAGAPEGTVLAFDVTLQGTSSKPVSVDYATADGAALAGVDYTEQEGTLRFAPGESSHQIAVPLLTDDIDELEETFALTLSDPAGATLDSAHTMATGTIEDINVPPAVSVADARGEEDSSLAFEISLAGRSSRPVVATYMTSDDTALEGEDYTAVTSSLTIEPEKTGGTIEVEALADDIYEDDETLRLVLQSTENATAERGEAVGTIIDINDKPIITAADADGTEGEEIVFEVSVAGRSSRPVTVDFATRDGTADADDYTGQTGTLTFADGTDTQQVTVALTDDLVHEPEPNERFTVALTDPEHADVATPEVIGEIEDNDEEPELSIADAEDTDESGTLVFPVTLTGLSSVVTTVAYRVKDGTATAAADYEPDEGVLTFEPGETDAAVEVVLIDDAADEPAENLRVVLGEATGGTVVAAEALGTIVDNDEAPTLSIAGGENVEGGELEFTVSMAGQSSWDVTVAYATADGVAAAGADYAERTGTLTFPASDDATERTVAVPLHTDDTDEPDEAFSMALSLPVRATLTQDRAEGTIVDINDPPLLSVEDARGAEDGELAFNLTLTESSSREVTVQYALQDGQAVSGLDYEAQTGEVTFAAGQAESRLSVTLIDDALDEPDEALLLQLSSPVNADLANERSLGWIEDNDEPPALSIGDADAVPEGGVLGFAVELSGATGRTVTVPYRTGGGTAAPGLDYRADEGVLTFEPGEVMHELEVAVLEDAFDEPEETLSMNLGEASHATVGVVTGIGSITDNDEPPALSIGDATGIEGGNVTLDVVLGTASALPVTVSYATADGTAGAGTDYEAVQGQLTFEPFELAGQIAVSLVDDEVAEEEESFDVTLSSPVNATLAAEGAVATVTDNDGEAVLSISGGSGREGATVSFTVSRQGSTARETAVNYATSDGTALAGADYRQTTGTLQFEPGEDALSIPVSLLSDAIDEPDEQFSMVLSEPVDATVAIATARGTVADTNAPPTVSVAGDRGVEGDAVDFAVTLSSASGQTVAVAYRTTPGSAEAGSDYRFASGTRTFEPGETSSTIRVPLIDDALDEFDENFALNLSDPSNAALGAATAQATIIDNDTSPALSITGGSHIEGGRIDFEVLLAGDTGREVSVRYRTREITATGNDDYLPAEGVLTFPAGRLRRVVSVTLIDDPVNEPAETFALDLSAPVGATIAVGSATGTILDDDQSVLLSVADTAAAEADGEIVFEVSLDKDIARPVTVRYSTADAEAIAPHDYREATGEITFEEGQRRHVVAVLLVDDAADEPDETLVLTLSAATNAAIARDSARGTILDDDRAATLTVIEATAHEGESAVFEIRRSGTTNRPGSVRYRTSSGTAGAGADFGFVAGTLVFEAGSDLETVSVPLYADNIHEGDESFRLDLSSPVGAVVEQSSAPGTILDRTPAPLLSIDDTIAVEGATAVFEVMASGSRRTRPVTVRYATADGTAVAGEDYEALTGELTLAPDDLRATIAVNILDDSLTEADETFSVELSDPEGVSLSESVGSATIIDEDGAIVLTVTGGAGDEGGTVEFSIELRGTSGRTVTVDFATADGTAVADADYVPRQGTLTFEPGTTAASVSVDLIDDDLIEPAETVLMKLTSPDGARIASDTARGEIRDNDRLPDIAVANAIGREGSTLRFPVTLTRRINVPVTLSFATEDGQAEAGSDYEAAAGALTLAPGDDSASIDVLLLGDDVDEEDESFYLVLSLTTDAEVKTATAFGLIVDAAGVLPEIAVTDSQALEDAGDLGFEVILSRPVGIEVSVAYRTVDVAGGARAGDDYEAIGDTLRLVPFETMGMVEVPILDDEAFEPEESFRLKWSSPTIESEAGAATGTIVDDDRARKAPTKGRALLFESTSVSGRQGFLRVINHSDEAGEFFVEAVDDSGMRVGPLPLTIGAGAARHFNSDDLESGNAAKGFPVGFGPPSVGSWRLEVSSQLDIEVLSYARTPDGFVTSLHDTAPATDGVHQAVFLNPGGNVDQISRLRLINPGSEDALVTITGTDDLGGTSAEVVVDVPAGTTREWTSAELETGAGTEGALGDGEGKWRLAISSDRPVVAMSLIEGPTGNLTNLSTLPRTRGREAYSHVVPLLPSASDAMGRQGFVRVVNRSAEADEVHIEAFDRSPWEYPPLTLAVGAGEVASFNSDDLELGNPDSGLTGSTGAGDGDWWLELSSDEDGDIAVYAYVRTLDGFLTSMHDLAPEAGGAHRVVFFNPAQNPNQLSVLWLVNPGDAVAEVTITGVDDGGASPGSALRTTVPAGSSRRLTSRELESGEAETTTGGALGDGKGKWRLRVESDRPIWVMSLLENPTGHVTNLSTATGRDAGGERPGGDGS